MEIKQSILQELQDYAEMFRNDYTIVELTVDLTLMIYSHPELQELEDHRIVIMVKDLLEYD